MRVIKNPAWVYYLADTDPHFDETKVGKWMYFFGDRQFVEKYVERQSNRISLKSVNTVMQTMVFLAFT